ncbi:MAG: hypothetical protein IKC72_07385 [Clostridia bacterium]|nr:hypothetical protein [Clostridia bacterium]
MEKEKTTFEERLRLVNENDTLKEILKILSYATLFVAAYAFFYGTVILFMRDALLGLCYVASVGLPYLLVFLICRAVKAPRPRDLFDFYEKSAKTRPSFPDRLVFLCFAVGTLTLFVHFILGVITLVLALCLSVCRPLLGHAFPRDAIAGGLIGIATSLIGYFLLVF